MYVDSFENRQTMNAPCVSRLNSKSVPGTGMYMCSPMSSWLLPGFVPLCKQTAMRVRYMPPRAPFMLWRAWLAGRGMRKQGRGTRSFVSAPDSPVFIVSSVPLEFPSLLWNGVRVHDIFISFSHSRYIAIKIQTPVSTLLTAGVPCDVPRVRSNSAVFPSIPQVVRG